MPKKKNKVIEKKIYKKIERPCPNYDSLGSICNIISNQLIMNNDGFDLSIMNVIADNGSNPLKNDQYFSMRHLLSFEGPLSFLMTGGQRNYTVECTVQKGKEFTLISNLAPGQGTLDGQWEQYWGNNISSLFYFAVTNREDPRLKIMLPNYNGKLSWANNRLNINLGKGQTKDIYLSTLYKLKENLLFGCKFIFSTKYDINNISIGGQYKIRSKPDEFKLLEGNINNKSFTALYSRILNKHATICTKLNINFSQQFAYSSLIYKYLFGSETNGIQILGEITSKLVCRSIFIMPFFQRFLLRLHGEMNHFDGNPRKGQVPHKFGFSIQMQI